MGRRTLTVRKPSCKERIEKGDRRDKEGAVVELQHHGTGLPAPTDHDALAQQARRNLDALSLVVVAGNADHLRPRIDDPLECPVPRLDGLDRRQRPVEHVAGHDDEVDPLAADQIDHLVGEPALLLEKGDALERPSQVPVAGVKDSHDRGPLVVRDRTSMVAYLCDTCPGNRAACVASYLKAALAANARCRSSDS